MEKSDFFALIDNLDIRRALPMLTMTSFHIGGAADVIFPKSREELLQITRAADKTGVRFIVIGNGTNLLIADEGLKEPVVALNRPLEELRQNGCEFTAPTGMLISVLAKESVRRGYTGLEWANGIPGTVGGAVSMNAGAYGGEISQALSRVAYIEDGKVHEEKAETDAMGYRKSPYCAPGRICLNATFMLSPDDGGAEGRMQEMAQRRIEKQPLKYPSAGSVFKRPEGAFAGALIEAAGLKGARVGGAQVSELHAGFIINTGGATCADVTALIRIIQKRVFENSGILLEPEIKILGMEAE